MELGGMEENKKSGGGFIFVARHKSGQLYPFLNERAVLREDDGEKKFWYLKKCDYICNGKAIELYGMWNGICEASLLPFIQFCE